VSEGEGGVFEHACLWSFFFLATTIYAEDINFSIFLAPENNNGAQNKPILGIFSL
jgi:hypothetical protein